MSSALTWPFHSYAWTMVVKPWATFNNYGRNPNVPVGIRLEGPKCFVSPRIFSRGLSGVLFGSGAVKTRVFYFILSFFIVTVEWNTNRWCRLQLMFHGDCTLRVIATGRSIDKSWRWPAYTRNNKTKTDRGRIEAESAASLRAEHLQPQTKEGVDGPFTCVAKKKIKQ